MYNNNYEPPGGGQPYIPPPPYYYPPDLVTPEEKRSIRKNYNSIGITLLVLYIVILVSCTIGFIVCEQMGSEVQYDEDGFRIVGTAEMIVSGGFPALSAMIVFAGYCAFAKYDPKELFSTSRIKAGEVIKYVLIVLFLQQVSFICSLLMMSSMYSIGLEVPGLNFVIAHDPGTYAADVISAVILAPIGEELIYRGVVLRCASKVSGRFAIFFSALMFGIMHGNPYQMVLGFLLGIPLAMITLKTGSIIPAIICHMANNLTNSITTIVEYFDEDTAYVLNIIEIPVFFIIGVVALIIAVMNGEMKLPPYSDYHRKRTLPIMITSWSMILITVIYIFDVISSIAPVETPEQGALTEAARMLFLK